MLWVRHVGGALAVLLLLVTSAAAQGANQNARVGAVGRHLLAVRGIWTYFEDRDASFGWHAGQLLHVITARSVQDEVTLQLREMRTMGVNEITYELRTGTRPWPVRGAFPDCELAIDLGPRWPQPDPDEIAGLRTLFGLIARQNMRVMLVLNNTHMQEPPERNQAWLGSILRAVKDSPALDLVAFGGDRTTIDALPPYDGTPDSCGGQSEAPLWLGPDSVQARYVQWALAYGRSLGLPASKLSAEAIVGFYPHDVQQGAGPDAQDRHLWRPLDVLRTIFDRLGTPAAARAYALSFYEHRKCLGVDTSWVPCTDSDAHSWAEATFRTVRSTVENEARATAIEFSAFAPMETAHAVEDLGALMQRYGIDGGSFWKWTDETGDPAWRNSPALVKVRGRAFVFNPVQKELVDLYGFHLPPVPNGSFEEGTGRWTFTGTPEQFSGDEAMPSRGRSFLRLQAAGAVSAHSAAIKASPRTAYTTSVRVRGSAGSFSVEFRRCSDKPSKARAAAAVRFAASREAWMTVPLRYTTPADTCLLRIRISGSRLLDLDDVH